MHYLKMHIEILTDACVMRKPKTFVKLFFTVGVLILKGNQKCYVKGREK